MQEIILKTNVYGGIAFMCYAAQSYLDSWCGVWLRGLAANPEVSGLNLSYTVP